MHALRAYPYQQPYLVEFVVKLAELGHLLHHLLAHEERSVEHREALVIQRPHRQVDQRLLQEHCRTLVAEHDNKHDQDKQPDESGLSPGKIRGIRVDTIYITIGELSSKCEEFLA